jgi:hypothetical protein
MAFLFTSASKELFNRDPTGERVSSVNRQPILLHRRVTGSGIAQSAFRLIPFVVPLKSRHRTKPVIATQGDPCHFVKRFSRIVFSPLLRLSWSLPFIFIAVLKLKASRVLTD